MHNSSTQRLAIARELDRLPCALARHLGQPCPSASRKFIVNSIEPCLAGCIALLEGPDLEVTPAVRTAVYEVLARSISHQTFACEGTQLDNAAQLAARGLKDRDRTVRINAG